MARFIEPTFTRAEINEMNSANLEIGYRVGSLLPGCDFENKPFTNKIRKNLIKAKEKLNGTQKKRQLHEKINSFGWARFENTRLVFGIKFSSPGGLTKTGASVVRKYKQLLGYYLEQAGWRGIFINGDDDYVIPLNNPENVKLLYTLSPSIGWYYKSKRPDMDDIEQLEYKLKAAQAEESR